MEEPSVSMMEGHRVKPEELVAKAIAPVKSEFLRPPPPRPSSGASGCSVSQTTSNFSFNEKKSKRQLKRERQEERKSALRICTEVARTGNIKSCPYIDKCHFSHDLEAFQSQKPPDIDGDCPFMFAKMPCPYGLACRFSGTHKDNNDDENGVLRNMNSEMNGLNKDTQKLLWKNKMNFSKADTVLKLLDITGKGKSNPNIKERNKEHNDSTTNGLCVSNTTSTGEDEVIEEEPSSKKLKASVNDEVSNVESDKFSVYPEGANFLETCIHEACDDIETHPNLDCSIDEPDLCSKIHPREKKLVDFRDKLYLAPLTTVGNLPFRRVCKLFGADVTCGEMAMCTNLLQGQASEWALLRRHSSEDLFGVQICGAYPDSMARTVELIDRECTVDFIDINMGCPIDIVVNKGAGSALIMKPLRMSNVIRAAAETTEKPITVKVRTGYFEGKNRIDSLIADIGNRGASAVTIHGRSRQQRYSKLADWDYIYACVDKAPSSLQVLGNGDVFSYSDWNKHKSDCPQLSSMMLARGALIKPWLFSEIKEQRDWDISSRERFDVLKDYVRFGLEHWGSDSKGVETTRYFLLEWLSYTHRYIPMGLLDILLQRLNWRPPSYFGRDDLETLMASDSAADWIRISEMLLGKVPDGFTFSPKHKSNAYDRTENG